MKNKIGGGQLGFVLSLVFIGLFTVAIIGFSVNFASDNNAAVSISDDSQITSLLTNTEGNYTELGEASQDTYTSIVDTTISPDSGSAQSIAPFTLTAGNTVGVVSNIVKVGYIKIFGSDSGFSIFLTTFIGMIVVAFAYWGYKALRGIPD